LLSSVPCSFRPKLAKDPRSFDRFLKPRRLRLLTQETTQSRQWKRVRDYARKKRVKIMGDMPIYVGYHNADVWDNRSQFLLNRKGYPLLVSGVPPDAFSETGQLWGSPLYDWKAMKQDGFSWWVCRMRRAKDLYDEFNIDHEFSKRSYILLNCLNCILSSVFY
ncbi:hypothetical protein V2J09_004406, partial [Rumex salicifolius]